MKDLLTGEEFEPKRVTQKFATPGNRIKYYNEKAKEERHELAKLDKLLKQNKKIIEELLSGKKEVECNQQFLLGKGFSFKVHNRVQDFKGERYFCVYQYIILNNSKTQMTKFILDDRY